MTAHLPERDARGGEVVRIEGAFAAGGTDTDDAAEVGSVAEEREEVGDEAEARVVG